MRAIAQSTRELRQSFSREKHPIYLATIHTSKGVALRGDEWHNEGDTKVRKGIIRHATTTIIPMTRRHRQHANILPPLSQEHGHPTRGHCKPIATHAQVAHDKQDRQLHKCAFPSGLTIRMGTLRSHQYEHHIETMQVITFIDPSSSYR